MKGGKQLLEKEKTKRRRLCNHVRKARSDILKELSLYFSNPWVGEIREIRDRLWSSRR